MRKQGEEVRDTIEVLTYSTWNHSLFYARDKTEILVYRTWNQFLFQSASVKTAPKETMKHFWIALQ